MYSDIKGWMIDKWGQYKRVSPSSASILKDKFILFTFRITHTITSSHGYWEHVFHTQTDPSWSWMWDNWPRWISTRSWPNQVTTRPHTNDSDVILFTLYAFIAAHRCFEKGLLYRSPHKGTFVYNLLMTTANPLQHCQRILHQVLLNLFFIIVTSNVLWLR